MVSTAAGGTDASHRYRACTRLAEIEGTAEMTPDEPASAMRAYSE